MAKPDEQSVNQSDQRAKRHGQPSPQTVAVLGAVIEKPSHGYEIDQRLRRRLGAEWSQRSIYETLARLERDGLLQSAYEQISGNARRVYRATRLGQQTRASWTHADIRSWILFSRPDESRQILARLEDLEHDCMILLEGNVSIELDRPSWISRMLIASRDADRERLEGELRWIKRTRHEIEEYMAGSP